MEVSSPSQPPQNSAQVRAEQRARGSERGTSKAIPPSGATKMKPGL
jgi:hypothetical protein